MASLLNLQVSCCNEMCLPIMIMILLYHNYIAQNSWHAIVYKSNCFQQPKTIEKGLDGILLKSDAENSKINYDSRHSNVEENDGDNLVAAEVPLTVIASNGDSLTCS